MDDHIEPPWMPVPTSSRTIDIFNPPPKFEEDEFEIYARDMAEKFMREYGPVWDKIEKRCRDQVE